MERKEEVTLESIARRYRRYDVEAYRFVFEALDHLLGKLKQHRHVTGAELSHAVRELALERFGYLARIVLNGWGVQRTDDFGEIVYHLVESGFMSKTDEDKQSDFAGIYDFHEAFDGSYSPPTGRDKDPKHKPRKG